MKFKIIFKGVGMKFLTIALISMFSFSAMAICGKGGQPWRGTGNQSQRECLAVGNQWFEGNRCNNGNHG